MAAQSYMDEKWQMDEKCVVNNTHTNLQLFMRMDIEMHRTYNREMKTFWTAQNGKPHLWNALIFRGVSLTILNNGIWPMNTYTKSVLDICRHSGNQGVVYLWHWH